MDFVFDLSFTYNQHRVPFEAKEMLRRLLLLLMLQQKMERPTFASCLFCRHCRRRRSRQRGRLMLKIILTLLLEKMLTVLFLLSMVCYKVRTIEGLGNQSVVEEFVV